MKHCLLLGVIVGLLAGAAFAYPTLTGFTGLVNLPNAQVARAGQFNLAADYFNMEDAFGKDTYPVRLQYGIADMAEVGVACVKNGFLVVEDQWIVSAKYRFPISLLGLDLAAGGLYTVADTTPGLTGSQLYLVGTRQFAFTEGLPAVSLTLGVNQTAAKTGVKQTVNRAFAGVEVTFDRKLTLAADFQTRGKTLDYKSPWGVVARYPLTPAITGEVGYSNGAGSFFGMDDAQLFAGVNVAFSLDGE